MNKKDLLKLIELKLSIIEPEFVKYENLAYKFLEAEAMNKINRYGKEFYKNSYLKNHDKNVSDFMKSFLYLKHTEEQLRVLKETLTEEHEKIKSK